ncbi:MAG TPA: hypothetical protein VIT85_02495 [Solirubrobacterales bacterium]
MRIRQRQRSLLSGVLVGLASVLLFAGPGIAADQTVEAVGISSWSPSNPSLTTDDTLTIKNPSSTLHGFDWTGGPTTPNCSNVPSVGQGNWEGTCAFTQAGNYSFVCTVHPAMTGTANVTGSGPQPPTVSTGSAASVTDTQATLKGTVNPNGLETEYFFEYGTTATYDQITGKTTVPAGASPVNASASISGLTANTTYHFQLVAENDGGTTEGGDKTFTTPAPPGPPSATTSGEVTGITATGATVKGTVKAGGQTTTYFFEYGTDTSYGQKSANKSATGTASLPASAVLNGLLSETEYHFRLVATNSSDTVEGADKTFTTLAEGGEEPPPPPPPPLPPPPDPGPPPVVLAIPDTTILGKVPAKTRDRTPTIKFNSTVAGATFQCKVDGGPFKPCHSPFTTKKLSFGKHRVQIRAVSGAVSDSSPAAISFKVIRPKPNRV